MKRSFIDRENNEISIRRQCELLGFNRSNIYYVHRVKDLERENRLREAIDKQFLKDACGIDKMVEYLKLQGHKVGTKLIRRLMRTMNLVAHYPKPKLSKRHPEHKIYPYLLKGLRILRPNQVWCADITYVQLVRGFCYLVAIMGLVFEICIILASQQYSRC